MLLEVKDLSKKFSRKKKDIVVADHISLNLNHGDYIGIYGPSGCGKSTLLHMIAGVLKPEGGSIVYNGEDLLKRSSRVMSEFRNSKIGYMIQGQSVLSNFTIIENVCLPYYLSGQKSRIYERALELLAMVGLDNAAGDYPSELSGGELRRIAVARALINSPELVIADEPTSNLDMVNAEKIMMLLQKVSQTGSAVLVCTHDINFKKYTTNNFILHNGSLLLDNNH